MTKTKGCIYLEPGDTVVFYPKRIYSSSECNKAIVLCKSVFGINKNLYSVLKTRCLLIELKPKPEEIDIRWVD
jgi:hypothetical protein